MTISLPRIISRSRLKLLLAVTGIGILQALSLIGLAWMTQAVLDTVLSGTGNLNFALMASLTALATLGAACRWLERIAAEKLGNNYIRTVKGVGYTYNAI